MKIALILLSALASSAAVAPPAPFDLGSRSIVMSVHASGAQIYECKAIDNAHPAWTFREPIAALIKDGKTIGRHYAGPHWALDDGSLVTGKQIATMPGTEADDIAQLELQIVSNAGTGALAPATAVYRLNTRGGKLAGACPTPGDIRAAPYAADYVFAR